MSIMQNFYKLFEIKKEDFYACDWDSDCPYPEKQCGDTCPYWKRYKTDYPAITDSMYIELLCIALKYDELYFEGISFTPETLKEWILKDLISLINLKDVKQQVQKVFKEINNESEY